MWILKFIFIVSGVVYELLHYVATGLYNTISKKISDRLYKPNKSQA